MPMQAVRNAPKKQLITSQLSVRFSVFTFKNLLNRSGWETQKLSSLEGIMSDHAALCDWSGGFGHDDEYMYSVESVDIRRVTRW